MGGSAERGVLNPIPVEETIIDPLYEPLKLKRYELCDHLQRLRDISHLRYGLSPYLLFDVEGMREVVETIGFLFRIEIKGKEGLKEKLREGTEIPEELEEEFKSKGIFLPEGMKKKEELMEGLWKIDWEKGLYIIVEEDNSLKVCYFEKDKKEDFVELVEKFYKDDKGGYKEFIEKFKKYLYLFERYVNWDGRSPIKEDGNIRWDSKKPFLLCEEKGYENKKSLDNRNEIYWELRKRKEEIIGNQERKKEGIYQEVKNKYRKILEKFLYTSDGFNVENYKKIAHLFRLEYPVRVKCPLCEEEAKNNSEVKPYMFMCEEGKIYSMKEALLRTFEFRRARWLYQSGMLHLFHKASTHTRLSHQIGCLIVAVNALREIDVYPAGDFKMTLGEYLLMRGELHEFLMANLLHDLGHPPLSHVLEVNPFIELDHEEITRNLILGKPTEEGKMDWYVAERILLKMKAVKDFEYRFFENRYDPIYEIDVRKKIGEKPDEDKLKDYFLEYLDKNNEILESEIITVTEVLDNFGVDKKRVVEILSGKVFCPSCKKLTVEIKNDKVECRNKECKYSGRDIRKEIEKKEIGKIYDIQFLNKLVDSEIDFDRIDHVKRDSDICGLSLTSFRLLELLGSISIVLPDSNVRKEVYEAEENKPYIFVSEDGLKYVMDLLNTRRLIFNEVLYSDENNWINGVVNQITAQVVRYLPHLTIMLPFITDPVLAHFYTNNLFLGTQIEKLNKLLYGEISYSAYGAYGRHMRRYKLKDNEFMIKEDLEEIYRKIEELNEKYERKEFPVIVFYTNIKPAKCPRCEKENLYRGSKIKCMKCGEIEENEIKEKIKKSNEERKEWNDMLVFCKKFEVGNERKYLKFRKLYKGKYKGTSRERFPKRPSELDVKNLFYVWVSNFASREMNEEIEKEISEIIDERFIDLDKGD